MAEIVQGSTLYAGRASKAAIYDIKKGSGFQWAQFVKTEVLVDRKPMQLTRAEHSANPLQANIANPVAADFTAGTATVTIDGRQITVTELCYLNTMKPAVFKETFPEYQPTGDSNNLAMNKAIFSVIYPLAIDAIQAQMNELHAVGDSTLVADPLEWYDGFVTLILADADATQVGATNAFTVNNILAKVKGQIQAVPSRLRSKPNLKTFCSVTTYDFYNEARAETQTQIPITDINPSDTLIQSFGAKVTLIPIEGFPEDFMFTTLADSTDKSNLVQGVWTESDQEAFKMFKATEGDQDYRIILRMDLGVQYKTGKDIFYTSGI